MGRVLRVTRWKIVRKGINPRFTHPVSPKLYECRGTLAAGERKGAEVILPKMKSFDAYKLTGTFTRGRKVFKIHFQAPCPEWLDFLKRNRIDISEFSF